jgi:hypothetical protein
MASQSAAASRVSAGPLAVAISNLDASIATASSGRASQTSLQREQRTVRPVTPKVAKSMA